MIIKPSGNLDDNLLPEYDFDYTKAKTNLLVDRVKVVFLDKNVSQSFTTPESVNKVLRCVIE
jgi:hypothetical protein